MQPTSRLRRLEIASRLDDAEDPGDLQPVTRDWLIGQARELMLRAKAAGNHPAAIAALRELAVLSGHRSQETPSLHGKAPDELSTAELNLLVRKGLEAFLDEVSGAERLAKRPGRKTAG